MAPEQRLGTSPDSRRRERREVPTHDLPPTMARGLTDAARLRTTIIEEIDRTLAEHDNTRVGASTAADAIETPPNKVHYVAGRGPDGSPVQIPYYSDSSELGGHPYLRDDADRFRAALAHSQNL